MSDEYDDDDAATMTGVFLVAPEENEIRISVTADGMVLIQLPLDDGQVVAALTVEDADAFLESYVECLKLARAINELPKGIAITHQGGNA